MGVVDGGFNALGVERRSGSPVCAERGALGELAAPSFAVSTASAPPRVLAMDAA